MRTIKNTLIFAALTLLSCNSYGLASSAAPAKQQIPFADSAGGAYKRTIPVGSQIGIQDGAASYTDGFPPLNFTPVSAGGVPPFGQDMNGIFNATTALTRWYSAGGPILYDGTYQTAIGGYPLGAIVQSATTVGRLWVSTTENNVTNPDTGGAGWTYPANAINADLATTATSANQLDSGEAAVTAHATTGDIFGAAANSILWNDATGTIVTTDFPDAPKAGMTRTLRLNNTSSFTSNANLLIEGVASGNTITLGVGAQVWVRAYTTNIFKLTYSYSGSFTITGTGFASNPTATATFKVSNGLVSLYIPNAALTGTSNAPTFTLTGLPASLAPTSGQLTTVLRATDNSITQSAAIGTIAAGAVVITLVTTSGAAWTASGTKELDSTLIQWVLD